MDLYLKLRTKPVLHRAWAKVRTSGLSSSSELTKRETLQFDADWLNNLEKIRAALKAKNFDFVGEKGFAVPKGKGKTGVRPLVVAPIANRVVRRAILEVLQGYEVDGHSHKRWDGIPDVRSIMETPTSIGGIKGRGVAHGLSLIDESIRAGKHWFVRSDIKNFFTQIPKAHVNAFICDAVANEAFTDLFEKALSTHLENRRELEELSHLKLFPDPETGVAQGSSLSALAGNIALRDFDKDMNGRDVLCVRYIDDFLILGRTEANVYAAYESARSKLSDLGMSVYDLDDEDAASSGKADAGNIFHGTDFLGYRVSGRSRQPCAKAQKKFLEKIDKVVSDCKREMSRAAKGKSTSHLMRYHQSMVSIHSIVWGWSQSFRHTTAKHVFESLDTKINRQVQRLHAEARRLLLDKNPTTRRRVMGIHLLADTPEHPLPSIRP